MAQVADDDGRPPVRARLADEVHEELLGRLLSHELEPGQRLTVDALSRELGVSQTPIREALNRLEAGGVVVRTHLAGYRVGPPLDRAQFEDLVEVRLLLEPRAARRAAERMDAGEADRLRRMAREMDAPPPAATPAADDPAAAGRSYAAFARHDAAFHDAVAAGSGNATLREAIARLHVHVRLFRLRAAVSIRTEALPEHEAVVTAIAGHDGRAAEQAMRRHIERSARRFAAAFPEA